MLLRTGICTCTQTCQVSKKAGYFKFAGRHDRHFELEKQRVISEAVDFGFKNCGAKEGETLTMDQAAELAFLLVQRMQPFWMRHIGGRLDPFAQFRRSEP